MPLISVIVPTYNPQEYLLSCLDSVFNQTTKNIEVILVNDGSKSEFDPFFADIHQRYPELKILNLKPNRGVAAARNHGIAHARGNYLCFIDHDDVWVLNKLELQSQYLDTHADCDYVTSRQRYFLAEDADIPPRWVNKNRLNVSLPGFTPGTLMARASAFHRIGGLDESMKAGGDDVDWFFRAHNTNLKTFELPEELLLKRVHTQNLSAQTSAGNKDLLTAVRINLQRKKASGT